MKKTGKTYLIDTNIIIDFFSTDPQLKDKLSKSKILIPSVVVGELCFGAYASSRSRSKLKEIEGFLAGYEIVSIDKETAIFMER